MSSQSVSWLACVFPFDDSEISAFAWKERFVLKFSTDHNLLRHLTSVYFSPLFCRVSHVHWFVMVNCRNPLLQRSCCSYVLRFARVKDCVLHVAAFSEGAFFDIRYMHLASLAKLSSTSSSVCSVIAHASAAFHFAYMHLHHS